MMHRSIRNVCALLFVWLYSSGSAFTQVQNSVTLGIEVLLRDSLHLVEGKRIGVVCNHTSVFPNGVHLVDSLRSDTRMTLTAIFTPEHGFRGTASAGEHIASGSRDTLPIYSLYGNSRKPTQEMLREIDVLVFDLQDVGARFYTYISTMGYCMEAASERGIPIIICDRPNPIRGDIVQGPVLDSSQRSFVGMYPIPVRHGMTVAEIARMAAFNGWLSVDGLVLHTVPMQGWKRAMWYDETGLPWIAPSPNIPDLETAILYPGMCFVEGTNLSEGRGTGEPFKIACAPFLDGERLAASLVALRLPGLCFEAMTATPRSIQGALSPKYDKRECFGVRVLVVDRDGINPIFTGMAVLASALANAPDSVKTTTFLSKLIGVRVDKKMLGSTNSVELLLRQWEAQAYAFSQRRKPFLLYD